MKKILLVLIGVITCITGLGTLNAACNDEEINAIAGGITHSINGLFADKNVDRDRVNIYIEDIPEEMYLIVVNNTTNERSVFKEIENATVKIETPNPNELYNYTVKVYSSSTICENELLRIFEIDSIAYNPYSKGSYCVDLLNKGESFAGCEPFTYKKYTDETFKKELEKYLNQKPENIENKVIDLFYKYYYFALIPVAILGIYYAIKLALIRRRKKKNEEQ